MNTDDVIKTTTKKEILNAIKAAYVKDYGQMDDRIYFMVGFMDAVIQDFCNPNYELKIATQQS